MARVVLVRGPVSRRRTLTWIAIAASALGGLKLVVREAAEPTRAGPTTELPNSVPTATRPPTLPYTVRARRVLEVAQQEAFRRAQPAYDQEDLLLGIAIVPESAGLAVLGRLGVSQDQLRAEAESALAAVPAQPSGGPSVNVHASSLTVRAAPRAQATLALAVDEALLLGHTYLGVEHLLLAILRQGSGPGCAALVRLGVALEPARAALRAYIAHACSCDACRSGTGTCS